MLLRHWEPGGLGWRRATTRASREGRWPRWPVHRASPRSRKWVSLHGPRSAQKCCASSAVQKYRPHLRRTQRIAVPAAWPWPGGWQVEGLRQKTWLALHTPNHHANVRVLAVAGLGALVGPCVPPWRCGVVRAPDRWRGVWMRAPLQYRCERPPPARMEVAVRVPACARVLTHTPCAVPGGRAAIRRQKRPRAASRGFLP